MTLKLTAIATTNIPLEVEGILPETLRDKSRSEIERLEIQLGNTKQPLAEFFSVAGDASGDCVEWVGDLSGVHWLGTRMTCGQIHVNGSIGRHVGSQMSGGRIAITGNAGDWVGGEMTGGLIHIHGNAGHLVGSAYRGSVRGMTGGTILVHGNAGNEIGHSMRRGMVAVGGNVGDLIGFNMLAGSVLTFGECGIRHGAGMRRGTIGLFGTDSYQPLPTFRRAFRGRLDAVRLMAVTLQHLNFPPAASINDKLIDLFNGDLLEGGRGELLVTARS